MDEIAELATEFGYAFPDPPSEKTKRRVIKIATALKLTEHATIERAVLVWHRFKLQPADRPTPLDREPDKIERAFLKLIGEMPASHLFLLEQQVATLQLERRPPSLSSKLTPRDRQLVIRYSNVLIEALQEALDYDDRRHHNRPPPALWLGDSGYQSDVRSLLKELTQLNKLLATKRAPPKTAATKLAKHVDKFLGSYAGAMGKVAAGLTGGAFVGLLYHFGAGDFVDRIWAHLTTRK
jgi:hypothetical protein